MLHKVADHDQATALVQSIAQEAGLPRRTAPMGGNYPLPHVAVTWVKADVHVWVCPQGRCHGRPTTYHHIVITDDAEWLAANA